MRLRTHLSLPSSLVQHSSPTSSAHLSLNRSHNLHKIVHIINSVDPNAGGPSAVITRLAAAQAARGHDVTILSFLDPASMDRFQKASAHIPGFDRIHLLINPTANSTTWLLNPSHLRSFKHTIKCADIVHLHGVWEPLLLIAARTAYKAKIPYVVRPCGMLDPWSLQQRAFKKRLALALGYRWMLNHAACLHVLNADEKRLIEQLKLTSPTQIVPNGVFLEEILPLPSRGTFHKSHPELQSKPYILFLSRLHHKKGLDFLKQSFFKIAANHPDHHLVIAGPDAGEAARLTAKIAASPFADRIHLVGALHGKDKFAALADATLFCLPSRQEGFSVATCEALACGIPVVISEACHFPEVAQFGAGRIVPLDPAAISSAMSEIINNPVLQTSMGKAGRQLMLNRFTWQAVAARCDAMYENTPANKSTPAILKKITRQLSHRLLQAGRVALSLF